MSKSAVRVCDKVDQHRNISTELHVTDVCSKHIVLDLVGFQ